MAEFSLAAQTMFIGGSMARCVGHGTTLERKAGGWQGALPEASEQLLADCLKRAAQSRKRRRR